MKAFKVLGAAVAALAVVAAVSPASAQWRHGGGWRGGYHHGGHYGHHRGAGVGIGLATGLIAGAAIASANNSAGREDYCIQRYRSYDPQSGTYLGNDGRRHAC